MGYNENSKSNKLIFKKIENKNIFTKDFSPFEKNNEIKFEKNIAILYGPNGTGKTSFCKTLLGNNNEANVCFEIDRESGAVEGEEIFHVISDQSDRNIIQGETGDFLVGDNIAREEQLRSEIYNGFIDLRDAIKQNLKDEFNITTVGDKLLNSIEDNEVKWIMKDFVNRNFKIETMNIGTVINIAEKIRKTNSEYDSEKANYKFIVKNYNLDNSIIEQMKNLELSNIRKNEKIKEIEENDEAIKFMKKFSYKDDECLVCENLDYNREELLEKKAKNKVEIENSLDPETKEILNGIIEDIRRIKEDPFEIESTLLEAISTGETSKVEEVKADILEHLKEIKEYIIGMLKVKLESDLIDKYNEYQKLETEQIEITNEDELHIKTIISEHIGKKIEVKRENNNRISINLEGTKLLGNDKVKLGLSTGEQNFISLSFELLKAKNAVSKYIILDDPISSFDSIYKNKIAYCIVKILKGRKQLILTHNTELIKLLEFQAQNCFELYLFNNVPEAENGFIEISKDEKELLLKLNKLLDFFRGNIWKYVEGDENVRKRFLIAMIPFMRGYANIIGEEKLYSTLCKVMHGYEEEEVNISEIYKTLFKKVEKSLDVSISVRDIMDIDLSDDLILNKEAYPLLNRTLYHTLSYLILRLKVEYVLCNRDNKKVLNKLNEDREKKEKAGEKYDGATTQQIINMAFVGKDKECRENRVFFVSRKTLLNEFNHFEGNMNIFQPAIDITDKALKDEKDAILSKLKDLQDSNCRS